MLFGGSGLAYACSTPRPEEIANSRLIAAAPEMYEALKLAKRNIQFLPEEGVEEKIEAALAKAVKL